jgi:hypothetical protein
MLQGAAHEVSGLPAAYFVRGSLERSFRATVSLP